MITKTGDELADKAIKSDTKAGYSQRETFIQTLRFDLFLSATRKIGRGKPFNFQNGLIGTGQGFRGIARFKQKHAQSTGIGLT